MRRPEQAVQTQVAADNEVWRPIVGFEGRYEVSSFGRVRGLPRVVHFTSKWGTAASYFINGGIIKPRSIKGGYLGVCLCQDGQNWKHIAHLVAAAFIGPRPPGNDVCHNDGNCTNNHADNLRYDT